MRRTKKEQIKDIKTELIKHPGITLTAIAGLCRMGTNQTREILAAMSDSDMILIKLRNRIYWNDQGEKP